MKDKLWVDSEVKSNLFIDFEVSLTTLVSFFFVNRFRISDIQISRYWKFESSLPFESILQVRNRQNAGLSEFPKI